MSETEVNQVASDQQPDPVAQSFIAVLNTLKARVLADDTGADDFARTVEFIRAVSALSGNWSNGLPVSGVVQKRRGRKPKAETNGVGEDGEPLLDEEGNPITPPPARGRGRPRTNF